jgi:hypothetical protein
MPHRNKNARHEARVSKPNPVENGEYSTERSISTSSEAVLAVGVDSFFTDLPPASLVPFVRNRLWLPDPDTLSGNEFPLSGSAAKNFTTSFNLFTVPENQSLILTYIAQTWLTSSLPDPKTNLNTTYTALPTTAGISGAAPLQVTINQNPIADAAGLYNDENWTTTTLPWYPPSDGVASSGFITQRANCLYFGQHKVFAIIPENQEVGALYTATYGTAVNVDERPDAIHIVCKGFLAPTKVVQKARKLYGI